MNTSEKTARRVPRRHMVGYGIGMFTSVSTLALVSLYLPYFYTDVFLLPPSVMAILFLIIVFSLVVTPDGKLVVPEGKGTITLDAGEFEAFPLPEYATKHFTNGYNPGLFG